MTPQQAKVLVTDFDGTLTQHDFFHCVIDHLLTPDDLVPWQRYERGQLNHFDALAEIFARIRAPLSAVDRVLDAMQLDHRLAEDVDLLQQDGWKIVVVSNGCKWYIDRLLDRAGVCLPVLSSPGRYDPQRGLLMSLPDDSPFYRRDVGIAKDQVVEHYRHSHDTVAFAGNGRPDQAPACLVEPRFRFARQWLAEQLDQCGESYRRFECWSEVADQLLRGLSDER